MSLQDTFSFASQAISRALGVDVIYNGGRFAGSAKVVLGSGTERVSSGDVAVSSRRLEVQLTAADFDTSSMEVEDWTGGTVQFLEGPLDGQVLEVGDARPDIEGVGVTLVLKRGK